MVEPIAEVFDEDDRKEILRRIQSQSHSPQWALYQEAKRRKTPTPEELARVFKEVSRVSLFDAAFLSLLYLSGCRAEEITRFYDRRNNILYPAFKKSQLEVVHDKDDKSYFFIRNRILKLRKPGTAENKIIYLNEKSSDYPFIQILEAYLDTNNFKESDELFPICYKTGYRTVMRYLNINPHIFRVWRSKILVQDFGITPQSLQAWMGWKSSDEPMKYSTADQDTIKYLFEKAIG